MPVIAKKILLSLSGLFLAILVSEIFLTAVGFKAAQAPFIAFTGNPERSLAEKGENYDGRKDAIYLADSVTFWKFKPGGNITIAHPRTLDSGAEWFDSFYKINSRGFRGDEFAPKKPEDSFRIIAIGDSITFGLLVEEQVAYYRLLKSLLEKEFPGLNIEVLSAGVPGYTTYQGLELLKKELLGYEPDIIIAYFGANNEFATNLYTDREYARLTAVAPLEKLSRQLKTAALLKEVIKLTTGLEFFPREAGNPRSKTVRVPAKDFGDDLNRITSLVKSAGAKPVLVVPPHSSKNLSRQPLAEEYAKMVRSIGSGAALVDADKIFKESGADQFFAADDVHLNEAGHKLLAEALFQVIREEIKSRH
ncbi:MAG TPA: GDSL-type esterase/lipase family protein [Candidatus Paceibacterota bacterium]